MEAYVRFHEENVGKIIIEKTGKEVEILKSKLEARLLEGEEEDTFLEKALADRSAYLKKCQQAKYGKKGKGGRGSRKRKGNAADEDAPQAKKTESE